MIHTLRRRLFCGLTGTALAVVLTVPLAPPASAAFSSFLTRAPYLTDRTPTSVSVSFGTTTDIVTVRLRYGVAAAGTCTPTSLTASNTGKQGYTITYPDAGGSATATGNQWKAQITGLAGGTYCYRPEGATSTTSSTYVDLLDPATPSPSFSADPPTKFAVIGDWGQTGATAPDFLNADQKNIMATLAQSGAGFAVTTGDTAYSAGSQSSYGDLLHTGPNVSSVFGPSYWPVPGQSIPMLPVPGNHGFNATFTALWPSTAIAAASGGAAQNGTYTVNGTPFTAPDYWYAYAAGGWRIYNLTAAWGQTLSTGNTAYAEDYARHWAPGAAERTWLTNDLAANPTVPKIAVFHFPLYSAVRTGDVQDPLLTAPTDGSQSLEALLATHNVKLVLNGHSHVYERNNPHNGLTSIISGGGGAKPSPVDKGTEAKCAQVYPDTGQPVVAFARGWSSSSNAGRACNSPTPTSIAQVFHHVRVTLGTGTATVEAVDSTGAVFDTVTIT
jgi:hypothetical protein